MEEKIMRTITNTYNVYRFDELSDEAKEKALDDFRYNNVFAWQDEIIDTIKAIAKAMNCRASWYSYDGIAYDVSFDSNAEEDIENLKGKRAYAYIFNNFLFPNRSMKTYWLNHMIHCDGRKNWSRKSKLFFGWDDCPFTGYCADCCFIEAWREWVKDFNKNSTVGDFILMVANRLGDEWTSDNEYQMSDEYIKEMFDINDYEFLEDGTVF